MKKTTECFENLIRNTTLFDLDPELEKIAYKRESLKLIEYLYGYLTSINEVKYRDYGLEITETAKSCIKNFSKKNGEFLKYFNVAMSKVYRKAYAQKTISSHNGGVHIPEQDQRIITKVIKVLESKGAMGVQEGKLEEIAEIIGVSEELVKRCLKDYLSTKVITDTYINKDNEEISIFDTIAGEESVTKNMENFENAKELLVRIETVFLSRQKRQHSRLSCLLTSKVIQAVSDNTEILEYAKTLSFWNKTIWDRFQSTNSVPTAKEIGITFGVSEQSISRTYKTFISLLSGGIYEY